MPINYQYKFKCSKCKQEYTCDTNNVALCKKCFYDYNGLRIEYKYKIKKVK